MHLGSPSRVRFLRRHSSDLRRTDRTTVRHLPARDPVDHVLHGLELSLEITRRLVFRIAKLADKLKQLVVRVGRVTHISGAHMRKPPGLWNADLGASPRSSHRLAAPEAKVNALLGRAFAAMPGEP
jgi:hypothetical protein